MRAIPMKLRNEMAGDPFYSECCLYDENCSQERMKKYIEWHHVEKFGGRQINIKAFILPACSGYHHKYADRKDIKERFMWIALNRATTEELKGLSKAIDYIRMRKQLNEKFGPYKNRP